MTIAQQLRAAVRPAAYAAVRMLVVAGLAFFGFFVVILLILRFVNPPFSAVMVRDHFVGARVQHQWTPIENISHNLIRAVISSEDARFCSHHGIDVVEWNRAMRIIDRKGIAAARGASTITMQVAKNLFLWTDRSFARKGLELAITPIIELVWPKRRILEVYLNIAQWGPGLFGIGVASHHHFQRRPSELTAQQAALLTATLPAPAVRRASAATRFTRRIAARIRRRMRSDNADLGCIFELNRSGQPTSPKINY